MNIDDKLKEARNETWDVASAAASAAEIATSRAARRASWYAARSVGELNKQAEINVQIKLILEMLK